MPDRAGLFDAGGNIPADPCCGRHCNIPIVRAAASHYTSQLTSQKGGYLVDDPLTGPAPREVPLPRAPLVRVIAQVRFPTILAVRQPDRMIELQEVIRTDYPELRPEQSQNIRLKADRDPEVESSIIWRFVDISGRWQAAIAPDFAALETDAYTSRDDFLGRLAKLFGAVEAALKPRLATRLGLRYIDRLQGPAVENIATMVRPEMLGLAGPFRERVRRVSGEALLDATEGRVRARWGLLPPGASFDPAAAAPIDTASWMLDLDMFREERREFVCDALLAEVQAFAKRIYTIFRWAVTNDFLRYYGGRP
jgi:uncharacterized protein (TIGR04255 family)